MTLENWNDILYVCLRSDVPGIITSIYLISWVFLGNYVFLNLFLAVLLEGFSSESNILNDDNFLVQVKD